MFQLTTPAIIVFFAASMQLSFASMLFRQKKKRGSRELGLVMVALCLYSIGTGLEHIALEEAMREFGVHIQYLGMPFLPFVLFKFITEYYQLRLKHEKLFSWIYFSLGFLFMSLQFTYPYHNLFYSDKTYVLIRGFSALSATVYPMYYLHNLFHLVGAFVFIYFSLYMMLRSRKAYWKRGILLILAVLVPVIVNIISMASAGAYSIDPLPYTMMLSTAIFMYLYLTDSLFGPIPVENRYVLESLVDGILVLDKDEVILEFNKKAAEYVPGLKESHIGRSLTEVFSEVELLTRFASQVFSETEERRNEVDVCTASGEHRYYEIRRFTVENKRKEQEVSTLIVRDVTERRLMTNELQRSYEKIVEADRLKGMVIDVMSHNLRSPLQLMKSLRQLIGSQEAADNPAIWERGGVELDSLIDRADTLIGNLLTLNISFDDEKAYPVGAVDIDAVLHDIRPWVDRIARKKGVHYIEEIVDGVLVQAHVKLLKIVLRNVLENAVKYTREGGEVTLQALIGFDNVKIVIEDTGVTISRDMLQAFEQDRWGMTRMGTGGEAGPGIGLYASRRFVSLQGGVLQVQQRETGGTRVILTLKRVLSDPRIDLSRMSI